MKRFIVFAVLALVSGLATVAVAQPRRGARGPGGGGPGATPDLPDALKLTLHQRQKIAELRTAALKKVASAEIDLRVKHGEVDSLWLVELPSRAALLKKLAEMDALHATVREAWIDFELTVVKLLTPAQRKTLAAHRGPGHLGGPGMGPGPRGWGPGPRGMGPGMGPGPHGMGPGPRGPGMGPGCHCGCGKGPGAFGPGR